MTSVELWEGDIVDADVEVIVNAANEHLGAGTGVCGSIFDAAGRSALQVSCRAIGGCDVGGAVITPSHALEAKGIKKIIHAVGPRWHNYEPAEAERLLESAYLTSLALAEEHGLSSIAFPSIGTGVFDVPKEIGAAIAVRATRSYQGGIDKVILVGFDAANMKVLQEAMAKS